MIDTTTTVEKIKEEKKEEDFDRQKEFRPDQGPTERLYKIVPNKLDYHKFIIDWDKRKALIYQSTYSEYVIFNPNQIRVRYVIHFKKSSK